MTTMTIKSASKSSRQMEILPKSFCIDGNPTEGEASTDSAPGRVLLGATRPPDEDRISQDALGVHKSPLGIK